ncbi:MAG: PAS domain-containing sensor histidine kinase, partial [Polaromonas sp. 28-63-22]
MALQEAWRLNFLHNNALKRASRRWSLWILLVALVVLLLAVLVWLAGRHESGQVQGRLEQRAADAVVDVRSALVRNIQSLQAMHPNELRPGAWREAADRLLRDHRELMRLEWRSAALDVLDVAQTPYRDPVFAVLGRSAMTSDLAQACSTARRLSGSAYTSSYFVPQAHGLGLEL